MGRLRKSFGFLITTVLAASALAAAVASKPAVFGEGAISRKALSIGSSTAANSKSMLDVVSTTKGALLPRMTTAQKNAIASPPTGLIVYDTDLSALFQYNGSAWKQFASDGLTFTGTLTGNASTATALAANGSNCSAGQFPLGTDASGAVESCTALPTTIAGTANQITASAATGAITLSIPNSPTLPGTTSGTFSGNLTGNVTGNASTATALAANGANCSAGSFPLGTDASGAAESCTTTTSGNTQYTANQYGVVVSGSGNTMSVIAPDASTTKVLTSGGASANPTWAAVTATVPSNANEMVNLAVDTSVSGNALTIALKQADGSTDCAAGAGACIVSLRHGTVTNGGHTQVSVTGALSVTISSGSTLGHISSLNHHIWVYAINNAGTLELGASTTLYDTGNLLSSTTEGGAGGADTNNVIYSTTGRSSVPMRVIARISITEATAGTWASDATKIVTRYFDDPAFDPIAIRVQGSTTTITSTPAEIVFSTRSNDTHGAYSTSTGRFSCPRPGFYHVNCMAGISVSNANADDSYGINTMVNAASVHNNFDRWNKTSPGSRTSEHSHIVACTGTDYISCAAGSEGTSPALINNSGTSMSILWVGAFPGTE